MAKKVLNKQDKIAGWRKCELFVVSFLASILNLSTSLVLHAGLDQTKQLFLSTRWQVGKMFNNQVEKIFKNQVGKMFKNQVGKIFKNQVGKMFKNQVEKICNNQVGEICKNQDGFFLI